MHIEQMKKYIKKRKLHALINKTKQKMINYDDATEESIKQHNPRWFKICHHPCKILITGGSRSGKINALVNLTKQQNDNDFSFIDKTYSYVKDANGVKY